MSSKEPKLLTRIESFVHFALNFTRLKAWREYFKAGEVIPGEAD